MFAPDMPPGNAPGGVYLPVVVRGGFAYVSGQLPRHGEHLLYKGQCISDADIGDAQQAAALCVDLCLAALIAALGGEERIAQIARTTGFIVSAPDFIKQSEVMDGALHRLLERLGERGSCALTSVGMSALPRGALIEMEMVVAVKE